MRVNRHRFETLESRIALSASPGGNLSDYIDVTNLETTPSYVSVDAPANHLTTPGGSFDGVVRLDIAATQGSFLGSGVLLPTGRHILTAAHNITGVAPDPVQQTTAVNAVFELSGGTTSVPVSSVTLAGDWNRVLTDGSDWAVLTLAVDAPADALRHDIYRDTDEISRVGEKAGYGQSGQGIATLAAGAKREGDNRYELFWDNVQDILLFDFDSGQATNDTFGLIAGLTDLGLGNQEVLNAPGDSGGPTFIDGKVAGITSFVTRASQGDSDGTLNFSLGEIGGDTRVSAFAGAIDALIDEVGLPQITDVRLDGSSWSGLDAYSYSTLVPLGDQLRPIFTRDVDTIEIDFSEHVLFGSNGDELTLIGSNGLTYDAGDYSFEYDISSHSGVWTFDTPLPSDKYRIELTASSITDTGGNLLDGDWDNIAASNLNATPTYDDFTDDAANAFPSGNGVAGGDFGFFFSLLAGDSNRDGIVDAADASIAADIDGDGDADASDFALIASASGTGILGPGADYNDDEIVDFQDYRFWRANFGTPRGGVFSAADYVIWRDLTGAFSAWYTGPEFAASVAPLFQAGLAPQVTDVTISGSQSTHADYSFASIVGGGQQLTTVPVGGADTISVTFSEDVNVTANDLTLMGLTSLNRPELVDFSYDVQSMTATWQFSGWTFGDHYILRLSDSVQDLEGDALDGEWTNPLSLSTATGTTSTFPSGDGLAGGVFSFVATLLPGDANLDGAVDGLDVSILSSNYGVAIGQLFSDSDFNGDGSVSIGDLSLLSVNWGRDLQAPVGLLADLDGDLDVDATDLAILYNNWDYDLQNPTAADGDLNGDGLLDSSDIDLLFEQMGLKISAVA